MRIHGRSGVAYLSRNYGDQASPVTFLSAWDITWTRNVFDVTAVTDTQIRYAAGQPDASGSFTGYYDSATAQSYAAAVDGLPRQMYLYPSALDPSTFFSGAVLPDYSIGGGVTSAVSLSVKWNTASHASMITAAGTPHTGPLTLVIPPPRMTLAGTGTLARLLDEAAANLLDESGGNLLNEG